MTLLWCTRLKVHQLFYNYYNYYDSYSYSYHHSHYYTCYCYYNHFYLAGNITLLKKSLQLMVRRSSCGAKKISIEIKGQISFVCFSTTFLLYRLFIEMYYVSLFNLTVYFWIMETFSSSSILYSNNIYLWRSSALFKFPIISFSSGVPLFQTFR